MTAQLLEVKKQVHNLQQRVNETIEEKKTSKRIEFEKMLKRIQYKGPEQLYDELHDFFFKHLDMIDDIYYEILTAWALTTWRIEDLKEIGYLLFRGVHGSGKTRALDTLELVCYHPENAATITGPAIYRTIAEKETTFLIDEFDHFSREKKEILIQILNAGYTPGKNAICCDPNDKNKVVRYACFGPKAVSMIGDIEAAFRSRCIEIPMIKNVRSINFRIDTETAAELKIKLKEYRKENQGKPLDDVYKILLEKGVSDYRLVQILNALIAVTPEDKRGPLFEYALELNEEIKEESGLEIYREIYEVLETKLGNIERVSRIKIQTIADILNEPRTETEQLSNRKIGSLLTTMGLTKKCRCTDGKTGRIITPKLMKRLGKRFKRGQQTLKIPLFPKEA